MARKHNHHRGKYYQNHERLTHSRETEAFETPAVDVPRQSKLESVVSALGEVAQGYNLFRCWLLIFVAPILALAWFLRTRYALWIIGGIILLVAIVNTLKYALKNLEADNPPEDI